MQRLATLIAFAGIMLSAASPAYAFHHGRRVCAYGGCGYGYAMYGGCAGGWCGAGPYSGYGWAAPYSWSRYPTIGYGAYPLIVSRPPVSNAPPIAPYYSAYPFAGAGYSPALPRVAPLRSTAPVASASAVTPASTTAIAHRP
jgi:hypothetical protein